jgi:Uri superfamily endonuclease
VAKLKSDPGTYALILQSHSTETVQVGRWGQLDLKPGYYLYIGSAFGPGGVQARVSRHLRLNKRTHWHIDYLRDYVTPVEDWVSYAEKHLEHEWAGVLIGVPGMIPLQGFGCSDCGCFSHLFFTLKTPESHWFSEVELITVYLVV